MKIRLSILPALLLLLISNAPLSAETLSDSQAAEIQPVTEQDTESAWPANQAVLFSASANGESGIHVRDQLPEAQSEEETRENEYSFRPNSVSHELSGGIYLGISSLIDGSQTIKKLIFPFHSYL